jgi:acyl-CoA dehydrogenase
VFSSPRIADRTIAPLEPRLARWRALEDRLEAFASSIAALRVDEEDEHGATRTYVAALARDGWLGHVVPARFGGTDDEPSSIAMCLVRQWLARSSGALDTAFVMQGLGSYPIALAGSPQLQQRVLPGAVAGTEICAFALTEPDAGSDPAGMRTTATPDGQGVVIDGEKCFISNAGVATSYVVFAREARAGADGKPRFGAFWLPAGTPGLEVEPQRVLAPHPIGRLRLQGVRVPGEHRIGAVGDGLRVAFANLDVFRVTVGAAAAGLAHLRRRVQFGKPLATQQGLRFMLAQLATDHLAAQLLVYRAAAARDAGAGTSDQAAMAKLSATETAQRVVDGAVQCLGGLGVSAGHRVERLYREVRALRIYEGTSEIQKLVIARSLLG